MAVRSRSLVVVAVCAAVTGCAASAPAGPEPPTALHSVEDQRAAERALPTVQDLGTDYATAPYVPSADARAEDARLSGCLGRPPTVEHETARAFSPQFTEGDARIVLAGITFVDGVDTASADLAALADTARAAPCLRDFLVRQLQTAGGKVDAVTATSSPGPCR
jgi:hypothetical protein